LRRYKQVKRKEVAFGLDEWEIIERRAAAMNVKTGTYIKRIAVDGEVTFYDMKEVQPLMNALRTISNNINQIARKANETHSIYAHDIAIMQEEVSSLCRTLNLFLSTLQSSKV